MPPERSQNSHSNPREPFGSYAVILKEYENISTFISKEFSDLENYKLFFTFQKIIYCTRSKGYLRLGNKSPLLALLLPRARHISYFVIFNQEESQHLWGKRKVDYHFYPMNIGGIVLHRLVQQNVVNLHNSLVVFVIWSTLSVRVVFWTTFQSKFYAKFQIHGYVSSK